MHSRNRDDHAAQIPFYQRAAGMFYWQENGTSNRGSLRTKDRAEAQRLLLEDTSFRYAGRIYFRNSPCGTMLR